MGTQGDRGESKSIAIPAGNAEDKREYIALHVTECVECHYIVRSLARIVHPAKGHW